jgi:hypothetical protein
MLKHINCQQEELRLQLTIICDSTPNSINKNSKIQSELEMLSSQELQLINEQAELSKHLRNCQERYVLNLFNK